MRFTNCVWYQGWFPELNMLETDEERRDVLERAHSTVRWSSTILALWIALFPVAVMCKFWLVDRGWYLVWEILFFTSMVSLPFVAVCANYRSVQRSLRLLLLKRGMPICLHCGYDLRGATGSRCSECGSEFEPIEPTSDKVDEA